jgi:hypothetical protein
MLSEASSALGEEHFMSSILTCGPFLHLFTHLGYRKRNLRSTSSMPPDGAPIMPKWPLNLVSLQPSLFHIFLFRTSRQSRKFAAPIFLLQMGFGSRERRCRQDFFLFFKIALIYLAHLVSLCKHVVSVGRARFVTAGAIDLKLWTYVPIVPIGEMTVQISVWSNSWLGHQGAKTENT